MRALHLRYPRRRWVVVSAIVVLLAAGGAVWWARSAGSSSANNPTYRLVAASTGTIRQSISSTGTIAPAQQDAVNFTVSGKVTRVAVTAGQRVSAGTVLATIDTATLTANLAQAQATLATAQAKVAADNADSSTTSTQLAADTAAATSAQGQVTSAQQAMSAATLTSPIAGVVAEVNLTVGQQVGGSSSGSGTGSAGSGTGGAGSGAGGSGSGGSNSASSSSTDQFLVIGTTSWVVNATVDSTGVGLIGNGDQAQIVPSSSPSVVYGTISSVGVMATTSSGVATFPVVISVTGNPPGLHAGDTATVSLIYKQLTDVLTVPTAAVHTVNGQRVVYLVSGGKQVSRPVQVGLSSGGSTQITSGLNEGDQVEVAIPSTSNGGAGSSASRSARPSGGTRQFPGGGNFGGGGGGGFGGGGGGGFGGGAPGTGGG
jgi:membrane fusion protein, macrolide-specific efflux system